MDQGGWMASETNCWHLPLPPPPPCLKKNCSRDGFPPTLKNNHVGRALCSSKTGIRFLVKTNRLLNLTFRYLRTHHRPYLVHYFCSSLFLKRLLWLYCVLKISVFFLWCLKYNNDEMYHVGSAGSYRLVCEPFNWICYGRLTENRNRNTN